MIDVSSAEVLDAGVLNMVKRAEVMLELEAGGSLNTDLSVDSAF